MTPLELARVVEDMLDLPTAPTPSTRLEQIPDWDSVTALRVIVYVEHHHHVAVDIEAFLAAETVRELHSALRPSNQTAGARHG